MHKWLLIALIFSLNSYAEIGEISELRGNGEVLRKDQADKLLAKTALGIFSYDDVRTGMVVLALHFLILLLFVLLSIARLLLMSISMILIQAKAEWRSKWQAEQPDLLLVRWEK